MDCSQDYSGNQINNRGKCEQQSSIYGGRTFVPLLCGWLYNTYQDFCFVPIVAVLVLAGAEFIFFTVAHMVLCFEFVMKNLITR